MLAARDASETATNWITIGRYGSGANPKIAPGGSIKYAIDFGSGQYSGGWKIDHIDLDSAQVAGVHLERTVDAVRGLWVTGSTITNITGVSFNSSTQTLTTPIPGYSWFTAIGLEAIGVRNTFVDNSTINLTDTPFFVWGGSDSVVDAVSATGSYYLHPLFGGLGSARKLMRGGVYSQMCTTGLSTGSAGVMIGDQVDEILDGIEIKLTPKRGPDGSGLDLELGSSGSKNTLITNCNIHDNDNAPIMINSDAKNSGTMFVGNTFTNNGLYSNATTAAVCRTNINQTNDQIIWADNTITKATGQNFLFQIANVLGSLTNDPTAANEPLALFGADNTVH